MTVPWSCNGARKVGGKRIGDKVMRLPSTQWKTEGYTCHPISFGQVVEFVECDQATRPQAMDTIEEKGRWTELCIIPYSRRMALDGTWIQWMPDECVRVPGWAYGLLASLWPVIRWIYPRPLRGQRTELEATMGLRSSDGPYSECDPYAAQRGGEQP